MLCLFILLFKVVLINNLPEIIRYCIENNVSSSFIVFQNANKNVFLGFGNLALEKFYKYA